MALLRQLTDRELFCLKAVTTWIFENRKYGKKNVFLKNAPFIGPKMRKVAFKA